MTDLAFGGACGLPSGLAFRACSARAIPSRKSMALSARPVKPMPVSARKERRVTPGQQPDCRGCVAMIDSLNAAIRSLARQDFIKNLHLFRPRRLPEPIQPKPETRQHLAMQLAAPWPDFAVLAVC